MSYLDFAARRNCERGERKREKEREREREGEEDEDEPLEVTTRTDDIRIQNGAGL